MESMGHMENMKDMNRTEDTQDMEDAVEEGMTMGSISTRSRIRRSLRMLEGMRAHTTNMSKARRIINE
jgi:hypothetical protein